MVKFLLKSIQCILVGGLFSEALYAMNSEGGEEEGRGRVASRLLKDSDRGDSDGSYRIPGTYVPKRKKAVPSQAEISKLQRESEKLKAQLQAKNRQIEQMKMVLDSISVNRRTLEQEQKAENGRILRQKIETLERSYTVVLTQYSQLLEEQRNQDRHNQSFKELQRKYDELSTQYSQLLEERRTQDRRSQSLKELQRKHDELQRRYDELLTQQSQSLEECHSKRRRVSRPKNGDTQSQLNLKTVDLFEQQQQYEDRRYDQTGSATTQRLLARAAAAIKASKDMISYSSYAVGGEQQDRDILIQRDSSQLLFSETSEPASARNLLSPEWTFNSDIGGSIGDGSGTTTVLRDIEDLFAGLSSASEHQQNSNLL